jgi:16S rRNA G1207 methylase RsmC
VNQRDPKNRDAHFEHYYTEKPTSALSEKTAILRKKDGTRFSFLTPSGVFSYGHIDRATRVLIDNFHLHPGLLLDIGCGYGVIGISLKKTYPALKLAMSDINERAIRYAKINLKNMNIEADIRQGDLFAPWENATFDSIVSNPPFAAGKEVWIKLIEESFEHLMTQGSLQLVAFHNKGGERMMETMKGVFGNVSTLVKSGGIRLYESIRVNENDRRP